MGVRVTSKARARLLLASALVLPALAMSTSTALAQSTFTEVSQYNQGDVTATHGATTLNGSQQPIYWTNSAGQWLDANGAVTTTLTDRVQIGTAGPNGASLFATGNDDVRSFAGSVAAPPAPAGSSQAPIVSSQYVDGNSNVSASFTTEITGTTPTHAGGYFTGDYSVLAAAKSNTLRLDRYAVSGSTQGHTLTFSSRVDTGVPIGAKPTISATSRPQTVSTVTFTPSSSWGAQTTTDSSGSTPVTTPNDTSVSAAALAYGSETIFDVPGTGVTKFEQEATYDGVARAQVTSNFSGFGAQTALTSGVARPEFIESRSEASGNVFATAKVHTDSSTVTDPNAFAYSSTAATSKLEVEQSTGIFSDIEATNNVTVGGAVSHPSVQHRFTTRANANFISLGGAEGRISGRADFETIQNTGNRVTSALTLSADTLTSAQNDSSQTVARVYRSSAMGNELNFASDLEQVTDSNGNTTTNVNVTSIDSTFTQSGGADASLQTGITNPQRISSTLDITSNGGTTHAGIQQHTSEAIGNYAMLSVASNSGVANSPSTANTVLNQRSVAGSAQEISAVYNLTTAQALQNLSAVAYAAHNQANYRIGDGGANQVENVNARTAQTSNGATITALVNAPVQTRASANAAYPALTGLANTSEAVITLQANAFGNTFSSVAQGSSLTTGSTFSSNVSQISSSNISARVVTAPVGGATRQFIAQPSAAIRNIAVATGNSYTGRY